MSTRRVGLWLIGAFGGVGSTAALGFAALAQGLADTTGLTTALPMFDGVDLDPFSSVVVGGHDIRRSDFVESVTQLHERAGVFHPQMIEACREVLENWSANVRPGTASHANATIAALADMPEAQRQESSAESLARFEQDLSVFRDQHRLDQVVVVNVASTEPPFESLTDFTTPDQLERALASGSTMPPSSIYALAAIRLGMGYVNFTPSVGAGLPAIEELARTRNVPISGKDGKTGETMMKSVLAPMFAHRNLHVMSWVGHNIFGNRDGIVLNDPVNKSSKVKSKDQLLGQILGHKPQTLVTIEYIESMDDWKTAWDHIHYRGFLGTKMILQFIWQGCDSLLAAPLVIDLARLTLLAQRRGEGGIQKQFSVFYKSPMGADEHHFFRQFAWLEEYAVSARTAR